MITIYETKTGKPTSIEHMVDAREAVANGSYTFSKPAPVVKEKPVVKKEISKPEEKKEIPKVIEKIEEAKKVAPKILKKK